MRVVVLHSEIPQNACVDEMDTLVQVNAVSQTLRDMHHEVSSLPFPICFKETIDALRATRPDLVFNLVETVQGKGRLIHMAPSVLDHLMLPYTGSNTEAIFLTSNKLLAKRLMHSSGLQTPPWLPLHDTGKDLPANHPEYIIKSVWEHASIGLEENSVVASRDRALLRNIMEARRDALGGECFAEAYVHGREFNISLLAGEGGPEVLPPAEILFDAFPPLKPRVIGYRAKWEPDSFEYIHTPRSFEFGGEDNGLLSLLADRVRECWFLFGLKGYARMDFRVDASGIPWIIDVNANPCLSPDAGFIAASKAAGIGAQQVLERIIRDRNVFS